MQDERVKRFAEYLEGLVQHHDREALAILKRSLAFSPGSDPRSFRYVERWTVGTDEWKREAFYLIAGIFALHPVSGTTPLPEALADIYRRTEKKSLEARFLALLDSDRDQLPDRLRRVIALIPDGVGIDWAQLTDDLLRWFVPGRTVQRVWARQFYRGISQVTDEEEGKA